MSRFFVVLGAILVCLLSLPAFSDAPDTVKLGRYTEASLIPTREIEYPLDVIIKVQLPRRMKLVGESVEYLLAKSGYRIQASTFVKTPEMYLLFSLPIPDQHRTMGTLRLETALKVLAGDAYEFHKNQVTREIWYSLKPELKASISEINIKKYQSRWEKRNQISNSVNLVVENEGSQSRTSTMADSAKRMKPYPAAYDIEYGPVMSGETLGGITQNIQLERVTLTQAMMSIFYKNPGAFVDENINMLKEGAILKIPTESNMKLYSAAEVQMFEERQFQEYFGGSSYAQ